MEPNNLNEWWGGQPDGLKQAFSLFPDGRWEEYQELFNRIYDELEMRITDYMNGQSKKCNNESKSVQVQV